MVKEYKLLLSYCMLPAGFSRKKSHSNYFRIIYFLLGDVGILSELSWMAVFRKPAKGNMRVWSACIFKDCRRISVFVAFINQVF